MADRPQVFADYSIPSGFPSPHLPQVTLPKTVSHTEQIGEAAARLGRTMAQVGAQLHDVEQRKTAIQAETDATDTFLNQARQYDAWRSEAQKGADYRSYAKTVDTTLTKMGNDALDALKDPMAKAYFKRKWDAFYLTQYGEGLRYANGLFAQKNLATMESLASDTVGRASSMSVGEGVQEIERGVQDLEHYISLMPDHTVAIKQIETAMIHQSMKNIAQHALEFDPETFEKDGWKKFQDRALTFKDANGNDLTVKIGLAPGELDKLRVEAPKVSMARWKNLHELQTWAEHASDRKMKREADAWVETMQERLHGYKPDTPTADEISQGLRKYSAFIPLHERDALMTATDKSREEGVSTPGHKDSVRLGIVTGHTSRKDILADPLLTSAEKAELYDVAKQHETADDISGKPGYRLGMSLIHTVLGKTSASLDEILLGTYDPNAQANTGARAKLAQALADYDVRMHKPGVSPTDGRKIAEEVIKQFDPAFSLKIAPPVPMLPAPSVAPTRATPEKPRGVLGTVSDFLFGSDRPPVTAPARNAPSTSPTPIPSE